MRTTVTPEWVKSRLFDVKSMRINQGHGGILLCLNLLSACHKVATSSPNEIVIVDKLAHPAQVVEVQPDTITLSDGRIFGIAGIGVAVSDCDSLQRILQMGVEIEQRSARVRCLVEVIHVCRDDPIVKQIERVDLADLVYVLNSAVHVRDIGSLNAGFVDGRLTPTMLVRLLEYYGMTWDERGSIDFP